MNWSAIVLVISLLLLIFSVWKEIHRRNRSRLVWRVVASCLAVAALAGIALPVTYPGTRTRGGGESILLTPGFIKDSLYDFKKDQVYTNEPFIQKAYPAAKLINLSQLKSLQPKISQLHILGYGLQVDELALLDSVPVTFHPTEPPSGISAIWWTDKVRSGQAVNVQGKFTNHSSKIVRLILKGLYTTVDSILIPAHAAQPFSLKDHPKNLGRSIYRLIGINGEDTLTNEPLPVTIENGQPLKVLMLSSSPGFENRFLKNWLSENGFAVAARNTISKNKFSSDFINMPQIAIVNLTPSVLSKFDVVLSDLSVLKLLSNDENAALKQQVTLKGLGLIINADTLIKTGLWFQQHFAAERVITKEQKPVSLSLQTKQIKPKTLSADQLAIATNQHTLPLVTAETGDQLASLGIAGAGKLVFTTLNNTYSWMLSGEKEDYSALWSLLIGRAAKTTLQTESWQTESIIPTINKPVILHLESGAAPSQIKAEGAVIAAAQDPVVPFVYRGIWWPKEAGWQEVKSAGGITSWMFIYRASDWKTLRALSTTANTTKYVENTHMGQNVTKQIHQLIQIAVPKFYFYILLLLCCTFLWLEAKLL
jgi:hypothetical protein